MKEKEPLMDIDEVEEVDIENMSMEELREFIAAAEAEVGQYNRHDMLKETKSSLFQQKEEAPTSFEKLTVTPSLETEAKMEMVEQVK